jgi:hypothetical protein
MLVSVEFADAGTKSGTHRILIIGRGSERPEAGDIGLSLEEAKTPISAVESEFVSAQAAAIVEARRQCGCEQEAPDRRPMTVSNPVSSIFNVRTAGLKRIWGHSGSGTRQPTIVDG